MRKLILFLLIGLCFGKSNATHLIGGRFQYKYLGGENFLFELILERDSDTKGANFEDYFIVGLYTKGNNQFVKPLSFIRDSLSRPKFLYSCGTVERKIELAYYSCIVNGSILRDTSGYYLNTERCCLIDDIINITYPGQTPYAALIDIPALCKLDSLNTIIVNNSPKLDKVFNPLICINRDFEYKINFIDPDGDSLVYRFITPIAGGYTNYNSPGQNIGPKPYVPINWYTPWYNLNNILDVQDTLILNPITGQINFVPTTFGDFLFSIAIDEYRNNKKIGTTYFQSSFRIIDCNSLILQGPVDQYSIKNSPVTFSMKHSNNLSNYRWEVIGVNGKEAILYSENKNTLYLANIDSSWDGNQYRCKVTNNGCVEYTNYATLHVRTTGIKNINKEEIKLVPNPANSHIEFKDRYPRNIKVYNTSGTLVLEKLNCVELDISSLANGVYTIQYLDSITKNTGFLKLVKTP